MLLSARPEFVLAALLAITLEQVRRGWKWRRILMPLREVRTSYLFGATMAGYLANLLVPLVYLALLAILGFVVILAHTASIHTVAAV